MTRNRVFLAAVMALASLGAMAQASNAGAPALAQSNQISAQQSNTNGGVANSTASDSAASAQASQPARNATSGPESSQSDEAALTNNGQLPQTSTILPLLGLIGLGSLVAGFFARR